MTIEDYFHAILDDLAGDYLVQFPAATEDQAYVAVADDALTAAYRKWWDGVMAGREKQVRLH